jgi:tetratricopeptide (TPR) repeat protein
MASSPVAAEPFCITLASSPDWVAEVVNDWPGPIAHEYDRLRRLLQADQLVASVWQLKDVAEVLIRFPACVMARDILEHGSDRAFQDETRRTLLGPPMSMGTWQTLAQTLAAHIVTHDGDDFFAPQVAGLFWAKKGEGDGKGTPSNRLANALTAWRNESFGHGAFRADLTEFEGELKDNLGQLHRELGHHRDAWQGLVLQRADGTPLTGAASIVPHQDAEPAHAETSEPLALVRDGGGELGLAPYVQLRRCTVCDCRDVFLFDWRKIDKDKRGRDKYRFIDYRAGHGNPSLWSQEPLLDAETGKLGSVPAAGAVDDGAVDADYTSNDVNEMLAERATAVRYRTPEYLRRRLETFLREQEAGIWWLRAPGHTGKSTFVSGLDPRHQGDLKEARLAGELADLAVVAFYIRREYQTSPAQLADGLADQLKAVLNVAAGARALPQLDLEAADPGPAMVTWLQAMRAAGGGRHRLLVCIDGLDELPPGTERSIADFIPAPDSLPEGLFFVVTSRPLAEMPASLAARLPTQLRGAAEVDVGLDDPEYRALLRAYFDDRLAKRRELEALEKPDPPHDFDRLFDQVLAKSDGRFLYLSYLADRLADLTLKLDGLDELPSAEGLFKQLLDDIEGLHAGSPLRDLFQRILLQLAAAEAAFEVDRQQQPAVAQEIWHGLPLELLARRVEGNSDGAVSLKLAYALYTLKPALGSWKGGEGRHASFQLGLKGLNEVIGARWPEELRSLHARQAQSLIDRLKAPVDGTTDTATELDADETWTLAHVVAHLTLGGMGETISEDQRTRLDSQLHELANQAVRERRYREAVRWVTRRISLPDISSTESDNLDLPVRVARLFSDRGAAHEGLRVRLGEEWSPDDADGLARAYRNLGAALSNNGDLAAALKYEGRAVDILEDQREQLGDQWPPGLASALASAYTSRGESLGEKGDRARALEDFGRAVDIHEGLRVRLGEEWSPNLARALARAYGNLGAALSNNGDLAAALKYEGRAIDIHEGLREQLGDQWTPDLASALATAYGNRGESLGEKGDRVNALPDHERAIAILERLQTQLGQDWLPAYEDRLLEAHKLRDEAAAVTK